MAVLLLLIGIILSFYHFIHSPSIRINFNELSTLSLVEGLSIVCLVSWTLLLFMRLCRYSLIDIIGSWHPYGSVSILDTAPLHYDLYDPQ